MIKRIWLLFFLCLFSKTVYAYSPQSLLIDCLNEIKKGSYENSYSFFSSSLKNEVSLEGHLSNLKSIELNLGHLISFSKGTPEIFRKYSIFKSYFVDENMFKNISLFKNEADFKYILIYEKGQLYLHAKVIKENGEYKISMFNMQLIPVEELEKNTVPNNKDTGDINNRGQMQNVMRNYSDMRH